MKHCSAFLAASILATAGAASATCADTLYLQSLVRTEHTIRVRGAVTDTVKVVKSIPMDSLIQAAPPRIPAGQASLDTARILLSFTPDCGTDSVSTAKTHLAVDSFKLDLRGNAVRIPAGRIEEIRYKAVKAGWTGRILSSGDTVWFQQSWVLSQPGSGSSSFSAVVYKGGQDILGAVTGAVSRKYTKSSTSIGYFTMGEELPGKGVDAVFSYYGKTYLTDAAADNAAADSAVVQLVSLVGVYDTKAVTYAPQGIAVGIAPVRGVSRAGVSAVAQGWKVTGSGVATGFVRSLDGRLVKSFPAGSSFVWDGRGAEGAKVRSGLYVVGFENAEAATLAVP